MGVSTPPQKHPKKGGGGGVHNMIQYDKERTKLLNKII